MSTPYIKDGYIYGVCSYGQLRCLKEEDGSRVWEDLRATGDVKSPTERWANAFLTPQGDRFFLFNEKGDLIIAQLTPKGYEEIDRAHLIEPTNKAMQRGRGVVAPGLRQQVDFRPQRQGDRLLFAGGGVESPSVSRDPTGERFSQALPCRVAANRRREWTECGRRQSMMTT